MNPSAFDALSDKHQAFVMEYLLDFNATRAAIRCGYSPKSAKQQGSRMLTNADLRAAIAEKKAEIQEQYKGRIMDRHEVLARLSDQARGSLSVFMDEDGTIDPKKTREIDREFHLLKKIEVKTETVGGVDIVTTKIEIYDAQAALDKLCRHHALFTDKTEVTGKDGGAIEVSDVKARLRRLLDERAERDAAGTNSGDPDGSGSGGTSLWLGILGTT